VRFEHGGDNIGYKCRLVAYARQGVGAVVMTNGDEGAPLITEIMHAVARDYGWPTDDDGETAAEPAGAAGGVADRSPVDARYAGAYVLADGLRCTVAVEQGHVLLIPATQPPIPLRRISGPTYALDRVNATLTFVMRADGQASGFTLRQHGEEAVATKIS
jgi:hypothetical protein